MIVFLRENNIGLIAITENKVHKKIASRLRRLPKPENEK